MKALRVSIILATVVMFFEQPVVLSAQRAGAILREARANRAAYEWFKQRQFNDDIKKISVLAREISNFRFRPLTEKSLKAIRGKSKDIDKRLDRIIDHVGMGPETEPSDFAAAPSEISAESIMKLPGLIEVVMLKLTRVSSDSEVLDLGRLKEVVADLKSVQEFNRHLSTP